MDENKDKTVHPNPESNCLNCIWYMNGRQCVAFEKIPKEVWDGEHNTVREDQSFDMIFESKGDIK